ncbi:hypothetical protein EV421DRAFT_1906790 [Armillaria borealis]|uniref:Uncharacterized protein n=1 Tax=Armillaria borealis TaxID=47425 RepID=A0AA39JA94_9AGAR|nr:hypothetical protein EV421DRAFT_1906790 [Armillaria borealis]
MSLTGNDNDLAFSDIPLAFSFKRDPTSRRGRGPLISESPPGHLFNASPPELKPTSPKVNTPNLYPPPPASPPGIRLDLVWQGAVVSNPLRIVSTFARNDFRLLCTSPACGMGWSFDLDLCLATTSISEKRRKRRNLEAI